MKTIKRIMRYLKNNIWLAFLSMLLALVSAVSALFIPVIIGNAIDTIGLLDDPDFIVTGSVFPIQSIIISLGFAAALVFTSALCQQMMSIINNKVTYRVVGNIREEMFAKLQKMPLSYLDTHPTGEIVSKMINDAEQLADGLLLGFSNFFTGVVTILGTIVLMLLLNWKVALLVICLTPLSFLVAKFISKHTYDMFKIQNETKAEQTGYIDEMIGNEKVVKSFGREEEAIKEFDEINKRLRECSLKAVFYSSLTNPSTRFVNACVYAAVALSGGLLAINGALSVGMLTTMLCYANQYTKPFNEITGVITELQNALSCGARIFEFLDEKTETDSKVLDNSVENTERDMEEHVVISNVSFSYTPEKPLIENFDLDVKPGQSVAIVGPTGCGKTTFINLLMRFYEINEGKIEIGGEDIRDMKRHDLRRRFGMVLQDTWIKNGTVLENILIGKADATREEAVNAAKAVHAHGFIKRLSNGYDTVLSDNGGDLSAGQKQLICIARVMLMQPDMLILDEATSNIDTRTEILISRAFDELMKDRTSFVVAHRLSTIVNADVILVMKDGHIIEKGKHEELLKKGGFYRDLYMSQYSAV
ncbi:MAG: ABC transporter ATP-binding protein/permease [Lachnospiraceae bacterium]|nr:ABC transporter ATP-binding protein/permease [Lachnospiraceae bacterium]